MTFLEVIESSEKIISNILDRQKEDILTPLEKSFDDINFNKVIIIASGSSYNAALLVKKYAELSLAVPIEMYYPNVFLNYVNHDLIDKNSLFIFISQGGGTKEVYNCVQLINKFGSRNILITENIHGPISTISEVVIPMGSVKEPYLFRTIGFDATCVTLTLILTKLFNGSLDQVNNQIFLSKNNLKNMISKAKEFFTENKDALLKAKVMIFIGANELWPLSTEAAIKFMEMVPIYTISYELEESIHGPQNAFNQKAVFFISSRISEENKKVNSIFQFIKNEVTSNVYKIDDELLKTSLSEFNYLEYITFYQALAYYTATENGKDLSQVSYPQLTDYIQKKFEDEK